MKRPRLFIIGLIVLLLAGSCAHRPPRAVSDPESVLKARATAYWQHRINGELADAYAFEIPAIREKTSLTNYIKSLSNGILLREATVQRLTLDGDQGIVRMKFAFRLVGIYTPKKGIPMQGNDYWELIDGTWYHAYRAKASPKKDPGP